jgi:hypothetical protein
MSIRYPAVPPYELPNNIVDDPYWFRFPGTPKQVFDQATGISKRCNHCGYELETHVEGLGEGYIPCEYCSLKSRVLPSDVLARQVYTWTLLLIFFGAAVFFLWSMFQLATGKG